MLQPEIFFRNKKLLLILLLGLVVRIAFLLWGANVYFNRDIVYSQGDTQGWITGFENIISKGVYTVNPEHEYGYFARLPGYSFFIGIFYFIAGGNWEKALPIIAWVQILLDVISIFFIYAITKRLFSSKAAYFTAFLYALYPFVVVWNPVAHTETLSIFIMLAGFYFLTDPNQRVFSFFLSGLMFGLGALMRPQILVLFPIPFLFLLIQQSFSKAFLKKALLVGLGVFITYGLWPVRNYVKYNKVVFTQVLKGYGDYWDDDVIAFMQYTFSVKSEWEPQFSSIVKNEPTVWPPHAYLNAEDSLMLERAVDLSKNCGFGFSRRTGYWKIPIAKEESCSEEIAELFDYLRLRQMEENPLSFYFLVPLQNLRKALFKSQLTQKPESSLMAAMVSGLFFYRTLLIILGIIGAVVFWKKGNYFNLLILAYFLVLYLSLCFGTTVQMRNIEMRYFLHADVLLLIPAGLFLSEIKNFLRKNPS